MTICEKLLSGNVYDKLKPGELTHIREGLWLTVNYDRPMMIFVTTFSFKQNLLIVSIVQFLVKEFYQKTTATTPISVAKQ